MTVRCAFLGLIVTLVMSAGAAVAQESLGDLVAQGGYDWLVGKWVATTDEGDQLVFEQTWGLDRHTILVNFRMRDFKLVGMIMFVPSREEVIQIGVDNQGGTWKGTWRDEYGNAVHAVEHTRADGEVQKAEIVYTKVDADTMKTAMYGLDSDGYRTSSPWVTATYKHQPHTTTKASAVEGSSGAAPGKLGELLAQNGYEWILGKWQGADDQGRTVQVTYALTLDKNAGVVDVTMGPIVYHGFVIFVPSREEVVQVGADNMGGSWKGTWSEDYEGLANRHEHTLADGSIERMEHVYVKAGDGTVKIKEYEVDASGYRGATPRGGLTLTRATDGKSEN